MRVSLDIPLSIKEVNDAIGGRLSNVPPNIICKAISTDSRYIKRGDLFFALKGEHFNGENFSGAAYSRGAIPITSNKEQNGIYVNDTAKALLRLAKYYKTRLTNLKHTVAITGSVGKTTTKEFLFVLLSGNYKTHKTKENFNNKIGLPLSILSAPSDTEILILEMGMNHHGEISELSKCASPDISVITNIGTAHIGNLGSRENIAMAKFEITDGMNGGYVIIPEGEALLPKRENTITFSTQRKSADIYIYILYNEGKIQVKHKDAETEARITPMASHNLECLCAAVAAAFACGIKSESLKTRFSLISRENTRQTIIRLHDFYILSDYYNSSLEAVISALDYMHSLDGFKAKSALIGDILELGSMTKEIHRKIGAECAEKNLKHLYLFGVYSDFIKEGAIGSGMDECCIFVNKDTSRPKITAEKIFKNHIAGEIILFKASHALELGRILELLKKEF